jgi:flagellar protein FlgJ
MTPENFVKTYFPFAKKVEDKTGISAIFILAQSALESGWGEKAFGNMMFGIKANINTPENKRQLITTTEYLKVPNAKFPEVISIEKQLNGLYKYKVKDWFRKYDTPEESFYDHADFFLKNPRYTEALKVKSDPAKFTDGIAKAGYATDPNYATVLKSMINSIKKRL